MTDILDELDRVAESDTCHDWVADIVRKAAHEIDRLRVKNGELNRRYQKAEAAARDTYVKAQRHGGSFGRVMANHAAGMWRDLAVVLADEMAYQMSGGDDSAQGEDHVVGPGGVIGMVVRLLADDETLKGEAGKACRRLKDSHQTPPTHGLPQMDIKAPMPPVKSPRKPMTKEDLARAMYEVSGCKMPFSDSMIAMTWDLLPGHLKSMWRKAAEEAIRKIGAD